MGRGGDGDDGRDRGASADDGCGVAGAPESEGLVKHASPSDCPCCFECLAPGLDTDRALVVAFASGVMARDQNVPMGQALCAKHAALARDALGFALEYAETPT